MHIYSDQNFYFFWKPQGIPSTFGQEKSLLDYFDDISILQEILNNNKYNSDFQFCLPYMSLDLLKKEEGLQSFVINQIKNFTRDQEYGLLNRLDNETWGFLYFAKTPATIGLYKDLQSQNKIEKIYLAQVHGNPFFKSQNTQMTIDAPIMHHRFDDQKMIVITDDLDKKNGRWDIHMLSTSIELINYDPERNISLIHAVIHKGIRHQIRIHCKSIGAPILWDSLYGPKPVKSENLCLWSIGMKI